VTADEGVLTIDPLQSPTPTLVFTYPGFPAAARFDQHPDIGLGFVTLSDLPIGAFTVYNTEDRRVGLRLPPNQRGHL
jgi:hypothetical protein